MLPPGSPLLWWSGYPVAFLLTCLIEVPVYLAAFSTLGWWRRPPDPRRPLTLRSAALLALGLNLMTHPLLWLVALRLSTTVQLMLAELVVALVEGLVIFAVVVRRKGRDTRLNRFGWSMLISLGVNTLSLLVGLVTLPAIILG